MATSKDTETAITESDEVAIPALLPGTRVTFHELFRRQEEGAEEEMYILGREATGTFITVPVVGIEALELLESGQTLSQATEVLSEKYEDDVDVASYIQDLMRLGFVNELDGIPLSTEKTVKKSHFTWIKSKYVSWLFSKPALIIYLFMYTLALFIVIGNPTAYFPQYQHYFFHPRYSVIIIVSFILGWVLVFKHELFHLFAGKSVGVEGRFGLSRRLHYIVAETDVTNLWTVDRSKRYIVYVAGMISDLMLMSVLMILVWFYDLGLFGAPVPGKNLYYHLAQMIIMVEWARVLWQFKFFLRTDVYYIIATFFNCKNLHGDSKAWLKNQFAKVIRKFKRTDLSSVPAREMRVVKFYGMMLIAGVSITIATAFYYGFLPGFYLMYNVIMNLLAGPAAGAAFWDSVIVFSIDGFTGVLFLIIILKERRKKKQQQQQNQNQNQNQNQV